MFLTTPIATRMGLLRKKTGVAAPPGFRLAR
jgi:hypothetical protein